MTEGPIDILLVEDNPSDVESYQLGVDSYIVKPSAAPAAPSEQAC